MNMFSDESLLFRPNCPNFIFSFFFMNEIFLSIYLYY